MILVEDVAQLPRMVMELRRAAGLTRAGLARSHAEAQGLPATAQSTEHRWALWETGRKSPILVSLVPYLRAHRVGMALTLPEDGDQPSWCPFRSRSRARCACVAGHGGPHRGYDGDVIR